MRRRGRDGVGGPRGLGRWSPGAPALSLLLSLVCAAVGGPARADDANAVVARVQTAQGEVKITAERLSRYAAQQAGRTKAELLDELVTFELLAAQASSAGLASDPTVRAVEDQALVRVFLGREFAPKLTDALLPQHYVDTSYTQNRGQFVRPELRTGAHILVTTAESKRPQDPALDAEAQRLAADIAERLRAQPLETLEGFAVAAKKIADDAPQAGLPQGLTVRAESLGLFAQSGPFVPAFGEAAFKQSAREVGSPFPTGFGWHVVWIDRIDPPINRSLAEVSDEVRTRIGPEVRQMEFRQLTDRLAKEGDAAVDTAPLEALARRLQAPTATGAPDSQGSPDGTAAPAP